jgi:RNA polymerase sigma factor (sigma-70 family)
MKALLPKVLEQLRQTGGGLTDGQLLARFVAGRDEDAFAALVTRHGPMVLGVCRRVLRNDADAEDAFQAAFLVLARKAESVARRDSVGPYLYAVAYHIALAAARANARRRARERQVKDMPHPEVAPAEAQDWRTVLDREVSRLSAKYRSAVVLCDLGGVSQRQAALHLGVPLSTVSSRLTRARELLAKRLAARGLAVSSGLLAAALASETASAQVPPALAGSTARVAALVAAGQLAGASTAPVALMKGVMRAMLMKKIRLAVGAFLVVAAVGAVGLAGRLGDEARGQDTVSTAAPRSGGKPANELDALRRENEDLRGTVRVLLKEIRTLQRNLENARARPGTGGSTSSGQNFFRSTVEDPAAKPNVPLTGQYYGSTVNKNLEGRALDYRLTTEKAPELPPDPGVSGAAREVESALRALREARDPEARRRAAEALERATRRIHEQYAPRPTEKKGA